MLTRRMKVSVDGGQTFVDVPDNVRIIYEGVDVPGEDGDGEVHLTLTHEGVITDIWTSRSESLDHNIATRSQTIDELVEEMIEEDS